MLAKMRRVFIPCFITIILPSFVYGMDLLKDEADVSSLKVVKKGDLISSKTTSNNPKIALSESKMSSSIILPSESIPISYEFLLIKYNYSDEYKEYFKYYKSADGHKPLLFKKITPSPRPEAKQWRAECTIRYEKYQRAYKDYARALETTDKTLQDSTAATFQAVLRETLRRHGSLKAIKKVQQIEEEIEKKIKNSLKDFQYYNLYVLAKKKLDPRVPDLIKAFKEAEKVFLPIVEEALKREGSLNSLKKIVQILEDIVINNNKDLVNEEFLKTDLSILFKDEIERIEQELIFPRPNKVKTFNSSPKKCSGQGFSLEPREMKVAIDRLRKLTAQLKRENLIQESVIYLYQRDYLPEVSSMSSWQQWKNWWTPEKEGDVKRKIKTYIEKKYPYGEYKILLMGNNPSREALNSLRPRELGVYLREGVLCRKIKDEPEIKINQAKNNLTLSLSLGNRIFERFKNALTGETTHPLRMEDKWRLLDFISASGDLSSDYFVAQTSSSKQDRKEVLCVLRNEAMWGWEWQDHKWKKILKEGVNVVKKLTVEEVSNSKCQEFKNILNDEEFSKYWQASIFNLISVALEKINLPIDFNELQLIVEKMATLQTTTLQDIQSHRAKMFPVLKELGGIKKNIEKDSLLSNLGDTSEYNTEEVEYYKILSSEFKTILIENRDQQAIFDAPYSYWTYIPLRRTFFASDIPYAEKTPVSEINLSCCNLVDADFYCMNQHITSQEKKSKKKPKGLLTGYKKIELSYNNLQNVFPLPLEVEELDLKHNKLSSLGSLKLLFLLTKLDISYNSISTLSALNYGNQLTSLTSLQFSYNPFLTDITQLSTFTSLQALNLSGNHKLFESETKNSPIRVLANLPLLHFLTLTDCGMSGSWLKLFPLSLDHLRVLDVRNNKGINFPTQKSDLKIMFPELKELITDNEEPIIWK